MMKWFGRRSLPAPAGARRMLAALLTVSALSAAAASQTPSAAQAEEMKKLDFLVGEWEGEGWELGPDGSRHVRFSQKMKIQAKIQGRERISTLRVKEERSFKPVISTGENTIFIPGTAVMRSSSLDATIYYDDALKLYRWRGENSYGRKNPLEAQLVSERTLQYGMPFSISVTPKDGYRKNTIKVTDEGEWRQTLEVWYRGRWNKVEEVVLRKVK
jgi:hypothetical protein